MTKKDAFFHLIDLFEQTGIRYALVGDTDGYPDRIGSDVDIVTDAAGLACFHRAVWSLEQCGLRVVQRFQHEITAFYYILAFRKEDGGWDFIQPDICTDYYRNSIKLLDASPLLARRRKRTCSGCPGGGYFVLSSEDEFAYYLFKKVGKKHLSDEQFRHLRQVFNENPSGCRARFVEFGELFSPVWVCLESNDSAGLASALPGLKHDMLSSGSFARKVRFRDSLRKLRRVFKPTGLVLAFRNGVSSERTTLLFKMLGSAFRRQIVFTGSRSGLFLPVLRAKIASTLVVLDGVPRGAARWLVDAVLDSDEAVDNRVVELLSVRAKGRHCQGRELSIP